MFWPIKLYDLSQDSSQMEGREYIFMSSIFFFFLIGIHSMQGWQPLQGMELQENKTQKD